MNLEHVSHGSGADRYICISKPLSNKSLPYKEVGPEGTYSNTHNSYDNPITYNY